MALPTDIQWYSDPSKLHSLPFPSLHQVQKNRFNFNKQGFFTYIGREKFSKIVDVVNKGDSVKLNIYGTIGYGKSHILAALACYFTRMGRPVFYIPDSAALVSKFIISVTEAFLLACAHPSRRHHWPEILKIRSVEDAIRFSDVTHEDFVYIVDQFDAVDVKKSGSRSDDRVITVAHSLEAIAAARHRRVVIESASPNSRSYVKLTQTRGDENLFLFGGMSDVSTPLISLEKRQHPFTDRDESVVGPVGRGKPTPDFHGPR